MAHWFTKSGGAFFDRAFVLVSDPTSAKRHASSAVERRRLFKR